MTRAELHNAVSQRLAVLEPNWNVVNNAAADVMKLFDGVMKQFDDEADVLRSKLVTAESRAEDAESRIANHAEYFKRTEHELERLKGKLYTRNDLLSRLRDVLDELSEFRSER